MGKELPKGVREGGFWTRKCGVRIAEMYHDEVKGLTNFGGITKKESRRQKYGQKWHIVTKEQ